MILHAFLPESFVDGPGVRSVVFFQGCPHNCVGCHNPLTHDYNYADAFEVTEEQVLEVFRGNPYLAGMTFSGGEPFSERNLDSIRYLSRAVHDLGKTVWAFTGYTLPALIRYLNSLPGCDALELLSCIDVLVDGPFCLDSRDTSLRFRGSANQRLIDIPKFLEKYHTGLSSTELERLISCSLL